MRAALIAIALLAAISTAVVAEQPILKTLTPTEKLDQARQEFKSKAWDAARKTAEDLLYPEGELARRDDVAEVHLLLGTCWYQLDHRAKAVAEYEKVLEIDFERGMPDHSFSEGAIKLFDETKERVRERIAAEKKRKEIAEREKRLREYIETIGVYESHSFAQNFIGFGAGQFQNDHTKKGLLIGGAQALTGAISLSCFAYLGLKYGLQARVPLQDGPTVRRIQQVEIGTGLAFFALYIISVIDGMVFYQPTTRVKGDDSIRDIIDDKQPLPPPTTRPKPKKTSLRDRLKIAPVLMPDGVGIGVGWETD